MKTNHLKTPFVTFTEDDEPILVLRASDPASTEAILAYLKRVIEDDSIAQEDVASILEILFQFKSWQANSTAKDNELSLASQRERIQLESMRNFLERNGGFRRRSDITNAYRITPAKELDRILPHLGVHAFKIQTTGRPTTYYVLPEHLEKFHQLAEEQCWTTTQTSQSADLFASLPTPKNS